MNSRIFDIYPRIPLFTTLLLFTITFFVYDDFGIRMILGYAVLMYVTLMYLVFRNNSIRLTRMKLLYLLFASNLSALILIGKTDASSITFVLSIVLCAIAAVIGDIRRTELKAAYWILAIFSILSTGYVIAVRVYPPLYTNGTRRLISSASKLMNDELLKQGYGISLGGNVVFIDYILMLFGLLTFNIIMAYKKELKHKLFYWGCLATCAVGMLFVNRKSELLSFLIALAFCYQIQMGISTRKEKKKVVKITAVIIVMAAVERTIALNVPPSAEAIIRIAGDDVRGILALLVLVVHVGRREFAVVERCHIGGAFRHDVPPQARKSSEVGPGYRRSGAQWADG